MKRQIHPGLGLISAVSVLVAQPVWAQVAQVTSVQLNPTNQSLEVILQTKGTFAEVLTSSSGQSLITDIPNAQLRLPSGGEFRQDNPTATIATVRVTNLDAKTIRVTVTGKAGVPKAEVLQSPQGLILSLTTPPAPAEPPSAPATSPATPAPTAPPAEPDQETVPPAAPAPEAEAEETPAAEAEDLEPIELVVTAEREEGYRVPDATTATKTETPLRDIPASIQVVPREVIDDQRAIRIDEAVRNVSGVATSTTQGGRREVFTIRGFDANQFRNGFLEDFTANRTFRETANLERIEVLKGPASVLFGQAQPGGLINLVTKRPLYDPYYAAEFTAGSFSFYRPTLDISGPLNSSETVAYRLNLAYENAESFRDFVETERVFVAPVLSWNISPNTALSFEGEYLHDLRPIDRGLIAIGDDVADIPVSRFLGDPTRRIEFDQKRAYLYLDHRFSQDLSLRSAFRYTAATEKGDSIEPIFGELQPDNRTLPLNFFRGEQDYETYFFQTEVTGKFDTGSIGHTALLGLEYGRLSNTGTFLSADAGSIDIFDPVYQFDVGQLEPLFGGITRTNTFGIYLQDQIALLDKLKVVLGGRFDVYNSEDIDTLAASTTTTETQAFSPRVGIVYQPTEAVSLYTNYSRSFVPVTGRSLDDSPFEPERGTQYEVGVKTDFLDGRLSSTLALYQITKSNVLTTDPNNPEFSIQVGEQRSRGIELDVAGEILPGWNVIASYAYTDAVVTQDNDFPIGNRLNTVPLHSGSLWTTYTIQKGSLEGLGFGAGVFVVGDRQGDLDNSFTLPAYPRIDAAVYYGKGNFKAAINLKNLFDIRYFEGAQSRTQVYPGTPFAVLGTVSVEF